ncbi:kinesin heavy chain [Sporodiniella umbellata]|nr:kinesin heavy chain [Sporodiniella umbellata]
MSGNNIKVVCRFRPQNSLEIREGGVPIVEIEEGTQLTLTGESTSRFAFDKVFGTNTDQQDVFQYSIKSIVDELDVTAGYNGTVFAYGQTGSGKTYTMMGSDIDDEKSKGIIPRIVEQIFTSINDSPSNIEFTVQVSYMEIYMERVRDLLNPSSDNLAIHEDKSRGVYVKGLYEIYVANRDEVYTVMKNGGSNRVVAYTNMNAESSRSHSIFVITITQKNLDTGAAKSGKLYLVDLAGSEKVGKTGASGQTLEEAKKINKSLTALGMVINSLTDGKSSHIPYRDSKLTRILQESLGGNSRTTLIINCSPSSFNEAETISTLRFGMRAKSIKNKAKVNSDLSPAELKVLLKKAKTETVTFQAYIAALEEEVNIWRGGAVVPPDQWVTLSKVSKGDFTGLTSGLRSPVTGNSRPNTPLVILEKDEREELLKRENELMDQISEKETEISQCIEVMNALKKEHIYMQAQESSLSKENQQMATQLDEVKYQLQNIEFKNRENEIYVDCLKEENRELQTELDDLKKTLEEVRQAHRESADHQKKKAERVAEMMSSLDVSSEISKKERQIRDSAIKIERETTHTPSTNELANIRQDLADSQILLDQHRKTIESLKQEKLSLEQKKTELDKQSTILESDCQKLVDEASAKREASEQRKSQIENETNEIKNKLENEYDLMIKERQEAAQKLKTDISDKAEVIVQLSEAMQSLKEANQRLYEALNEQCTKSDAVSACEREVDSMRQAMAKELADFEVAKKTLMRDLQVRYEKVTELETTIDESRELHMNVLKNTNSKAQQQKLAILEHNIEKLKHVQKQVSQSKVVY